MMELAFCFYLRAKSHLGDTAMAALHEEIAAVAPTFCQRIKKLIEDTEREIDRLPEKIERLEAAIRKEESSENPDPDILATLRQELEAARHQLEDDRLALPLMQEDFDALCVPHN
jgi:DNA repair exonuclease SbcCD ATPase subunit